MDTDILEIERGIIGTTQLDYEQSKAVLPGLVLDSDFADSTCRALYRLFLASNSHGEYQSKLFKAEKASVISSMLDGSFVGGHWLEYAVERIGGAARARRIRSNLITIQQEADEELLPLLSEMVEKEQASIGSGIDNLPMVQAEEAIKEMRRNDTSGRFITGLPTLDSITGGLRPGSISILGAYPSAGKTAFALNVVLEAVRKSRKVLFITLEMSATQLWERLASAELRLSYEAINNKRLPPEDLSRAERLIRACGKVGNPYIADNAGLIERQIELIYRVKPDLVIVDFLQYCRTGQRFSSVNDRLEWMVSEYKRLAKLPAHPCHIMVLSQLARTDGKQGDMFALRGSGGIEAGGDYIFLLDRPMLRNSNEPPEKVILKVAKNKYGWAGKELNLYFDGNHQRFRELQRGEEWGEQEDQPW